MLGQEWHLDRTTQSWSEPSFRLRATLPPQSAQFCGILTPPICRLRSGHSCFLADGDELWRGVSGMKKPASLEAGGKGLWRPVQAEQLLLLRPVEREVDFEEPLPREPRKLRTFEDRFNNSWAEPAHSEQACQLLAAPYLRAGRFGGANGRRNPSPFRGPLSHPVGVPAAQGRAGLQHRPLHRSGF